MYVTWVSDLMKEVSAGKNEERKNFFFVLKSCLCAHESANDLPVLCDVRVKNINIPGEENSSSLLPLGGPLSWRSKFSKHDIQFRRLDLLWIQLKDADPFPPFSFFKNFQRFISFSIDILPYALCIFRLIFTPFRKFENWRSYECLKFKSKRYLDEILPDIQSCSKASLFSTCIVL